MAKKRTGKTAKSTGNRYELGEKNEPDDTTRAAAACQIMSPRVSGSGGYVMSGTSTIPTICAKGITTASTTRVLVTLIAAADTEPAPPDPADPVGYADANMSGQQFWATVSYEGSLTDPPEDGIYKVIAYPVDNQNVLGTAVKREFNRVKAVLAGEDRPEVQAQMCPWLAFAGGASGPFGDNMPPVQVDIPSNAQSVSFSVDPLELWTHDTENTSGESNADGRPDLEATLEVLDYIDSALGSDVITPLGESPVNILIGLWKGDSAFYEQFAIGTSLGPTTIPINARFDGRLFLAMHDGKRWSNNDGAVNVQIEWTPEACTTFQAIELAKSKKDKKKTKKKRKK